MPIKPYTSEKATGIYIDRLELWAERLSRLRNNNRMNHDDWIKRVDAFPWNKRGHVLMILDPRYFGTSNRWQTYSLDPSYKGRTCLVLGLQDITSFDYHPPKGAWDLVVRVGEDEVVYSSPEQGAYRMGPLPPYVFLPSPNRLRDFDKFLPLLSRDPARLHRRLADYYAALEYSGKTEA